MTVVSLSDPAGLMLNEVPSSQQKGRSWVTLFFTSLSQTLLQSLESSDSLLTYLL